MNAQTLVQAPAVIGTPFESGRFAGRIVRPDAAHFAIVTAPKAEGEFKGVWNKAVKRLGADSFIDGLANTRLMADAGSAIAKKVLALRIGGHEDWHIPALDVKEQIYRNLKPNTEPNWCWMRSGINLHTAPPGMPYTPEAPAQTIVEDFQAGGAQAFDEAAYWTSTEYAGDSDGAWYQNFYHGGQGNDGKSAVLRVRAVRLIPVSPL